MEALPPNIDEDLPPSVADNEEEEEEAVDEVPVPWCSPDQMPSEVLENTKTGIMAMYPQRKTKKEQIRTGIGRMTAVQTIDNRPISNCGGSAQYERAPSYLLNPTNRSMIDI